MFPWASVAMNVSEQVFGLPFQFKSSMTSTVTKNSCLPLRQVERHLSHDKTRSEGTVVVGSGVHKFHRWAMDAVLPQASLAM